LFDPINPDKDTIQTRLWNRQERLDNEYFLVEKLEDINERANFHELPPEVLQQAMVEHDVNLGVRVCIASLLDLFQSNIDKRMYF